MNLSLAGVYPPMLTPFREDGKLDIDSHLYNMSRWNEAPLNGYLVLGSNSETAYLTENEKLLLIEKSAEMVPSDRLLIAGTGMESTQETISLTQKAAERGAKAALILTPFYYLGNMTDAALTQHFLKIADAVDIPVLIYNVPKFAHINVSNGLLAALMDHPNIIGMKDSSGNIGQIIQYQSVIRNHFQLLAGTAAVWYPALTLGINGGIMALANIFPSECTHIQSMVKNGLWQDAELLYRKLYPVNHAITATYGVAGLKYAADLLGFKGGYVRSPLMQLNDLQKQSIKEIINLTNLV
ncbi:MAG: dihydrodipicolinate synthase family protein [Bacteroidetes bacterium]|jgi:4-hydroxy-2-oxoglutarate aldolase|nr:dihydrodipicolinate synthase family protein [Bacteroidota bacterium]